MSSNYLPSWSIEIIVGYVNDDHDVIIKNSLVCSVLSKNMHCMHQNNILTNLGYDVELDKVPLALTITFLTLLTEVTMVGG